MFKLSYVPTSQELIDKAFRRGSKKAKAMKARKYLPRDQKLEKAEESRISSVKDITSGTLREIVREFPSYEKLPGFYRRLLDLKIGKDDYKRTLASLEWCSKQIDKLSKESLQKLKNVAKEKKRHGEIRKISKAFLGRVSSLLKRISKDMEKLREIKSLLEEFPYISEDFTIVVAGYPNVGKSSFVRSLTKSKLEVANYPFTTKQILVGRAKLNSRKIQLIDTPGILDREMSRRNKIELEAILAIEELANVILFLIDPFSSLDSQLNLLKEILENFSARVGVAINKIDLLQDSAIEDLKKKLEKELKPYLATKRVIFIEKISAIREEDAKNLIKKILDF